MKLRLFTLVVVFILALPVAGGAREVRLKSGEVFRDQDLAVICEAAAVDFLAQDVVVRQCQYWDDFFKKCLFEKVIHSYNDLECVEDCQQWDSFKKSCDFQNKCLFYPRQEVYVRSTCAVFDQYSHECLNVREEKIWSGK